MSKEAINAVRKVLDIHRDTRVPMPAEYMNSAYRNLSVVEKLIVELEAENARLREAAQMAADALGELIMQMPDEMFESHSSQLTRVMAGLSLNGITTTDR